MSGRVAGTLLDCVVVGAGAAGLAAAATLREAGRTFVVLEARDRLGGRAHTVRLSGGQAAERGAEYLHGARVATWEFVTRLGLATHLASGPTRIGVPEYRGGEWRPEGASDSDGALRGLGAALAIADAADVSLHEALVRAGFTGDRLRAAEGRMEVLSPIDPTVVSARSAAAAWRLVAPETANFVLVGGYAELWDGLSRPFADRIQLASPVTALEWSGAGVAAFADGRIFAGRTAIVTLPVGVLESGGVAFRPDLPDRKRARSAVCGAGPSSSSSPSSGGHSGRRGSARSRASARPTLRSSASACRSGTGRGHRPWSRSSAPGRPSP